MNGLKMTNWFTNIHYMVEYKNLNNDEGDELPSNRRNNVFN